MRQIQLLTMRMSKYLNDSRPRVKIAETEECKRWPSLEWWHDLSIIHQALCGYLIHLSHIKPFILIQWRGRFYSLWATLIILLCIIIETAQPPFNAAHLMAFKSERCSPVLANAFIKKDALLQERINCTPKWTYYYLIWPSHPPESHFYF